MNLKHLSRAIVALLALSCSMPAGAQGCPADLTFNGIVDGADLSTLLAYWGPRTQDPASIASDLNADGVINGADLSFLLAGWGPCTSAISSVAPTQGCFVGGTQITIVGSYLGSASAVTVGGVPATSFGVVNAGMLTAVVPAGALGPASIRVTTAAGTVIAPEQFTYMPASVSSISPSQGLVAGGTQITITGAYLGLTTGVTIGGQPATNVTVVDAQKVTAVTPAGAIGGADVVISGGKGTIAVPGAFRYVSIVVPSWAAVVEERPDPLVITDPALRASIEATGFPWRVRDSATQVEMLLVPPAEFLMGCIVPPDGGDCGPTEQPVHAVTLTNPFYLGRFEITQAQWQSVMGSNPSVFQTSQGYPGPTTRPVESVGRDGAGAFAQAVGMRLPTEAEWECACRAGTQTPFYNGSTDPASVGELAWFAGNAGGRTHPVGERRANGLGFHDMLGNVDEWVSDRWLPYSPDAQTNPAGGASGVPICRGGSFPYGTNYVRASYRGSTYTPGFSFFMIGFRVARDP